MHGLSLHHPFAHNYPAGPRHCTGALGNCDASPLCLPRGRVESDVIGEVLVDKEHLIKLVPASFFTNAVSAPTGLLRGSLTAGPDALYARGTIICPVAVTTRRGRRRMLRT